MNRNTIIVIAVVAAIVGAIAGKMVISTNSSSDQQTSLEVIVDDLNKQLPMRVDENTSWISSIATGDKTLTYVYRIVGIRNDQIDTEALISHLKPIQLNVYRTNPNMKQIRDLEVDLQYVYQSEDGNHLFEFLVEYSEVEEVPEQGGAVQ